MVGRPPTWSKPGASNSLAKLFVCTFVTLFDVHITSDVERLGSAVDSFGAKWDSSLSKNGLGFWLTTNVVPVT